jgi:hypothetical protein
MEGAPAGTAGFIAGGFAPPTPGQVPLPMPTGSGSGPNPALAGILAGFFPFGVGAVYTGQYAKGLAHLAIFGLLIAGASASDHGNSEALGIVCGLGIAFFYVYQIIDAVRSAKAIQMAQPIPDPFGLAATFGGGARMETSKIPIGAIVLIGIGLLFLLHTMGLTEFGLDRFWPLILIGAGAWLFARNWGLTGSRGCAGCQCARCRSRRLMGPAMLLTIGFLFLFESMHVANFDRTWPVILLVVGAVKLLQGSASTEGHVVAFPPGINPGGPIPPTPPYPPAPSYPSPPVYPAATVAPENPVTPITPVPPSSEVNRG